VVDRHTGLPLSTHRAEATVVLNASQIDLADLDWTDWADDPYPIYRRLRDEAPVFWDERNQTYVITRYEDVYRILLGHRRFSSVPLDILEGRQPPTSEIRQQDEPRHGFIRNTVAPLFNPGAMRRREERIREIVREIVDTAEGPEVVEVSTAIATPLPGTVALELIGLPRTHHERFSRLMVERLTFLLTRGSRAESSPEALERFAALRAEMWEMVTPLIEERRAHPENDAISRILEKQDEVGTEELSDDVFLNMLLELVTGGFETTQHLIESLISHLADHPDLWARMRDDRTFVPKAIEEMLRFRSPTQALGRRPLEDVELHGVTIPADSWVTVVYGSANRDEREFDDPDTYDIDRDLRRHVAFSAGVHYCPGAPVSRAETRLLLEELLDRYRTIERAGPSVPNPNPMPGKVGKIIGWSEVPVRFLR
jgi:cytochrome P450